MKAAIYARYSTENQSADSIDDQFRVCERLAERHGFTVVERFSDRRLVSSLTITLNWHARAAASSRRIARHIR